MSTNQIRDVYGVDAAVDRQKARRPKQTQLIGLHFVEGPFYITYTLKETDYLVFFKMARAEVDVGNLSSPENRSVHRHVNGHLEVSFVNQNEKL